MYSRISLGKLVGERVCEIIEEEIALLDKEMKAIRIQTIRKEHEYLVSWQERSKNLSDRKLRAEGAIKTLKKLSKKF